VFCDHLSEAVEMLRAVSCHFVVSRPLAPAGVNLLDMTGNSDPPFPF
jgi:hypothetical protein